MLWLRRDRGRGQTSIISLYLINVMADVCKQIVAVILKGLGEYTPKRLSTFCPLFTTKIIRNLPELHAALGNKN